MIDRDRAPDAAQRTLIEALAAGCERARAPAGRSLFTLGAEGPLVVIDALGDDLAHADRGGLILRGGRAGAAFETGRPQRAEGLVPGSPGVPAGLVAGADRVDGVWIPLEAPAAGRIGVLELWYRAGSEEVPADVLE